MLRKWTISIRTLCLVPLLLAPTVASAEPAKVYPQGLTCGLAYDRGGFRVHGECFTYPTLDNTGATYNFHRVFAGDMGLPANRGFVAQNANAPVGAFAPEDYPLPAGTVCGFGHSKNAPDEECFRWPIRQLERCPTGWTFRRTPDANSDRHYWYWCDKDAPGPGAVDAAGEYASTPRGTVCGLHHGYMQYRQWCGGTSYCPTGFSRRGSYDDGAASGVGLTWCFKD